MHPFCNENNRQISHRPLIDQSFFISVPRECLSRPVSVNASGIAQKPWFLNRDENRETSPKFKGKNKFYFNVDLRHYVPQDVSVKTANGFVVVEADHGERQDEHGFLSRGFTKRYQLPENIEPSLVIAKLSSDGILTITAALTVPPRSPNERIVPIVRTGPVRAPERAAEMMN